MKIFLLPFLLLLAVPAALATEPLFEVRAVAERSGPATREYLQAATEGRPAEKIDLEPEVLLGISAVRSASAEFSDAAGWVIHLNLTGAGSAQFVAITTKYLNKRLAFLIHGKLHCAPVVRAVIGQSVDVCGDFSANEATSLANGLNAAVAEAAPTPGSP